MTKSKKPLCDVCHERIANHHICNGSTGESSSLCGECFKTSAPPEMRAAMAQAFEGQCPYCGGQSCVGGSDFLAFSAGVPKSKYMCLPCSTEYHEFVENYPLSDISGLSQQEQMTAIRRLRDEVDAHMKRWVLEKGSR
jgi:hypothetical protein